MKRKILIALGIVLTIGLVSVVGVAGAVGVAAAEGEAVGGRLRHGHILAIDGHSIQLETRRGEVTVLTDEDTRYRIPTVTEPGLDDLAEGDHIGLAGRPNEEGAVLARLIVRIPQQHEVGQLRGELTDKGEDWLVITRPDGVEVAILINAHTRFRIPEVDNPSLEDLDIGDQVYARGLWNDEIQLQAQLVGLTPEGVEDTVTGRVLEINNNRIELLTRQGPAVVISSDDTRFHIPNVENPALADIEIESTLVAGGRLEDDGLHAVVIAITPERPQRVVRRGVVTANDGSTLTLETPNGPVIILTDEQTRLRVARVENPTLADIQVGYQALVGGRLNEDNSLLARGIGARPAPAGE